MDGEQTTTAVVETTEAKPTTGAAPAEAKTTDIPGPVPYDRFAEVNKELAALRKWRTDQEKAAQRAEAERLAKTGEWESLAKQHETAAASLASELEALKAQLAEAAAAVQATYEARVKALPKEAKQAVDSLPGLSVAQKLAWLDANAALFARPTPPNINATDQGASGQARSKQEDIELWRRLGLNNAVRAAQQDKERD